MTNPEASSADYTASGVTGERAIGNASFAWSQQTQEVGASFKQQSSVVEENARLVGLGVLPDTTIGAGQFVRVSDRAGGSGAVPDTDESTRPEGPARGSDAASDGRPQPDRSSIPVESLARRTAEQLAANSNDPAKMQTILTEALGTFGRQHPSLVGMDFARQLTSALRESPVNHGLELDFHARDSRFGAATTLSLFKVDENGRSSLVAEQSHTNPTWREDMIRDLSSGLPLERQQSLEAARDIYDLAGTLNTLQGKGIDLSGLLASSVAEFQSKYPTVRNTEFVSLLQEALRKHPDANTLHVSYAGYEGVNEGFGRIELFEITGARRRTELAEAPMSFDTRNRRR